MSDSVWPHRRQPTRLPGPWESPGKNTEVGCHCLLVVKNSLVSAGDVRDASSIIGFGLWVRKIPWRRAWQPTPIFLLGEFYGQGSLVGYSPQACKELDTTEATEHRHIVLVSLHIYTCLFFYFLLLICEITHFDAEIWGVSGQIMFFHFLCLTVKEVKLQVKYQVWNPSNSIPPHPISLTTPPNQAFSLTHYYHQDHLYLCL